MSTNTIVILVLISGFVGIAVGFIVGRASR